MRSKPTASRTTTSSTTPTPRSSSTTDCSSCPKTACIGASIRRSRPTTRRRGITRPADWWALPRRPCWRTGEAPEAAAGGGGKQAETQATPVQPSGAPASARSSQPLTGLGLAAQGPAGGGVCCGISIRAGHVAAPLWSRRFRRASPDRMLTHPRCVFQLLEAACTRGLHPGDGRADHRHPEGSVPEGGWICSRRSARTAT